MKIYVEDGQGIEPVIFPSFVLERTDWDDYSIKSTFKVLYYADDRYSDVKNIGEIKIIQQEQNYVTFDHEFYELSENFISLGQSLSFYENLLSFCKKEISIEFLEAVNDISWRSNLSEPFETSSSFRNSLVRMNSAEKARQFGKNVIEGIEIEENFDFIYKCRIKGAKNEMKINFNFDDKDPVPGRIVGIIGQNATGKTSFLSQLALDLVSVYRISLNKEKQRTESFYPHRPTFNRVLTLSFSVFDNFKRPKNDHLSYIYCGIRNERGIYSKKNLNERFEINLRRINEASRLNVWEQAIRLILGNNSSNFLDQFKLDLMLDLEQSSKQSYLELLSSGQTILVHAITSLISRIDQNSLILFDEPETHLHPNAVATLFYTLSGILRKYKSYCIIATHSPIVIQEIPGKRVILFRREDESMVSNTIQIETFGENISELTRHVFDTAELESFYKNRLKMLSEKFSFNQVLELFDHNLSMSAQSFLLTQYKDEQNEET